jgi:DNA polymerase-3 subunit gamma/tau
VCDSCQRIWAGKTSLDVVEIDAASNRGVDDARDLRERAMYAPSEQGRFKVYIIDEAHMLTREAWNALLKILEEPPARVIFVFATTEPQKIQQAAPPILSRCQRFDFHRIGTTDLVRRMRDVLSAEGVAAADDVLLPIAQKADGGMRDALSLLDQVLSFTDGTPTAVDVRRVLGLVGDELYLELMDILAAREHAGVFGFVRRLLDDGYDLAEFYRGLADFLRALLIVKLSGPDAAEIREDLHAAYAERVERFAAGDLLRMLAQVAELDADGRFRKSGQQQILIELLLLRFSFLDRTVALEDVLQALRGGAGEEEGAAPANPRPGRAAVRETPPAPPARPAPPSAPPEREPARQPESRHEPPARAAGPLDVAHVRRAWRAVLEDGDGVPAGMGLVLRPAQVSLAGEDAIRVAVPPGSPLLERMESPAARRPLEEAIGRRLRRPVRLAFAAADGPAGDPSALRITAETARRDRLRRLTAEEPLLAAAVQEWDLELID